MEYIVGQRYRIVRLNDSDQMKHLEHRLIGQEGVFTRNGSSIGCMWLKLDNANLFANDRAFAINSRNEERGTGFLTGIVLEPVTAFTQEELAAWDQYDMEG